MSNYQEGRAARRDGATRAANPYAENTHPWRAWDEGWRDGDAIMRAIG